MVLLDAARACSGKPPDLGAYPVDFVVLSYYKIFGYPTGVGALVARREALEKLKRRYFGGGTLEVRLGVGGRVFSGGVRGQGRGLGWDDD